MGLSYHFSFSAPGTTLAAEKGSLQEGSMLLTTERGSNSILDIAIHAPPG